MPGSAGATITLLIPTLNEIDGMRQIMPKIEKSWCDQILILDGGSTDGTIEFAKEHGYDVIVQEKPGLLSAYRQAYSSIRGEIVITFSPDGNSLPELIPNLIAEARKGYDMVIVSRYLAGATSKDDTRMTRFGNFAFTTAINLLFGGKYTDALVIFRAYKKSIIPQLGLLADRTLSIEYACGHMISWEPLLSMRAAKRKLRISEIPGDEPARVGGVGKYNHYKLAALHLMEMVQEFVFWKNGNGAK